MDNQDVKNQKVLISSPIHNRATILPYYLKHIENLTYPKNLISLFFIVNNSTDDTLKILKNFRQMNQNQYRSIEIKEYNTDLSKKDLRTDDMRKQHTYSHLATLRNKIVTKCAKEDHDWLLSCDSDILMKSTIIEDLLYYNKKFGAKYIASLIYNGYKHVPIDSPSSYNSIEMAYKFPNVLKNIGNGTYKHICNWSIKNPNLVEKDALCETDFTGACFLSHKDVCKDMVYAYHSLGEDEPASRSAIMHGNVLYYAPSVYSQHIMDDTLLEMYLNGQLKFANGEVINIK
jgi:hypothetical protein